MTRFAATTALALLLLTGCGRGGPARVPVTGAVTFRGRPVKDGEIRFFPLPNTKAPMTGALIRDGRYLADARGGVPVGRHRVQITAAAGADATIDRETQAPGGQYLPAKYNAKSELELTVPAGRGPITQDYHLTE